MKSGITLLISSHKVMLSLDCIFDGILLTVITLFRSPHFSSRGKLTVGKTCINPLCFVADNQLTPTPPCHPSIVMLPLCHHPIVITVFVLISI